VSLGNWDINTQVLRFRESYIDANIVEDLAIAKLLPELDRPSRKNYCIYRDYKEMLIRQ
jgi:hypothetical protein